MESWAMRVDLEAASAALCNKNYARALAAFRLMRFDAPHNVYGMSLGEATASVFRVASPNLESLAAALNGLEAALRQEQEGQRYPLRLEDVVDTTSLPVYADADADLGLGAFSWDETRALVPENPRTGATEWTVVPRWDLEAEDE